MWTIVKRYRLRALAWLSLILPLCMLPALVALMIWLLSSHIAIVLVPVLLTPVLFGTGTTLIVLLSFLIANLLRRVYQVTVTERGRVTFRSLWRHTTVPASQIISVTARVDEGGLIIFESTTDTIQVSVLKDPDDLIRTIMGLNSGMLVIWE